MSAITVIAGIILILGGIAIFFTPIETFLAVGFIIAILFLIYGIAGLIKAFQGRSNVWEIILDVLAILVGIACVFFPGGRMVFEQTLLFILAAWFIVQGVFTFVMSIKTREFNVVWVFGLIVGVISVILGIISLFNPAFEATVLGFVIGIYFIEAGINMIFLGSLTSSLSEQARRLREDAEKWRASQNQ
jgi:uncharacterized membrane protein HdeD (DUF308 family)